MRKLFGLLLFLLPHVCFAQGRQEIVFSEGWLFSRDSISWQEVTVPHDWAIAGPFDKKWDLQFVAIEQNGEKEKTEKSGRSGALPWIGKGFYRKEVLLDRAPKEAMLVFDGAMSEPVVKVNGQFAGRWAYGYNAFRLNVAKLLRQGKNTIEVSLSNMEESSRWYPGGGLFRPVKLILGGQAMLDDWETYFRTVSINQQMAVVDVQMGAIGDWRNGVVTADVLLRDQRGVIVAQSHSAFDETGHFRDQFHVRKPQLWSPESPYLYTLETRIYKDLQILDEKKVKVGIRTVAVGKEKGFQLNGQTRKIKGVCLHHDLGPLGAAVNKAALIRQIRTMKEMGCVDYLECCPRTLVLLHEPEI